MNVGVIVDNDYDSDIRVTKEVKILRNLGYNVFILCYGYSGISYRGEDKQGITIHRIWINKWIKNFLFIINNRLPIYDMLWSRMISRFILKYKINIIHAHDLYMSRPSYMGIKISGKKIPLILDLHENYPEVVLTYNWTRGFIRRVISAPEKWKKKENKYLKYPTKIIVVSKYLKKYLCSKYPFLNPVNIIEYLNVIDIEEFSKYKINPDVKKKDKFTLLYFGVVAERRGIFESIAALREVLKKGYDVLLLIIGPVDKLDKKRFYNEIKKDDVKNNIEYIPWIEINELPSYLQISDVCISPLKKNKHHDTILANKIFQYMYGRRPIIASNCIPQKEIIEENNCGLIFSDLNGFVHSIIKLLNDENLRTRLGKNARKALFEKFNSKIVNQSLINLYKELEKNITQNS